MELYLACPTYDGKATLGLEESLKQTAALLPSDIRIRDLDIYAGCCYLPIARNKLVRRFMDSGADTFMFLDADISWPFPQQFFDFLRTDVEVLAGLYRYKQWDEGYPCHIFCDAEGRPISQDGLIKAEGVPTGFLKIKRSAFERMIDFYGDSLEVDEPNPETLEPRFSYWNFFDTEKVGRTWIGEDYNFCRYFLMSGGEIWVYPDITLEHYGQVYLFDKQGRSAMRGYSFAGNYQEYLMRLPGGIKSGPVNHEDYPGNDIDGWMTQAELEFLFQESSKYESVVEIGSFKGRSAHALLSGLAKKVICIDPWNYEYHYQNSDPVITTEKEYQEFLANVAPVRGGNGRLQVIRDKSENVFDKLEPVDMVFIDGDHSYESTLRDIKGLLPKAKKLICGHDFTYTWPTVKKAVYEVFGDNFKLLDSIWYVELEG